MLTAPALMLCQYPTDVFLEPPDGWILPNANDQQRLQRYTNASARTQFALSRLLLREAVAWLLAPSDTDWRLITRESGQPVLEHPRLQSIALSISHTSGLIAIALAPASSLIGVDVEAWTRRIRLAPMLSASMNEADSAWCRRQTPTSHGFIRHWTLKEAYLKSLGQGVAADLPGVSFDLDAEVISLRKTPYTDSRYWYFDRLSLLPDYCIALAHAADEPLSARWTEVTCKAVHQLPQGCQLRMLHYC